MSIGGATISQAPARAQQSYRHEALLWRSAEDYTASLSAFVTEGLESGEPVLVAVVPQHREWLADALGDRARAVGFVDMTELGANPARILPAWQEFIDANSGRPVRGVGEPIWPGRRPVELLECQLHEALLNVAVDPLVPLWLLCPYDTEGLGAQVVEEAHRSHPVIITVDGYQGSTRYGGRDHVDSLFAAELPPLGPRPITTTVAAGNVERLESYLRLECYVAGLSAARAEQLAAAAQKLALGSLHRGAEQVVVRVWSQPDAVSCDVSDTTVLSDVLHGRRTPLADEHDGVWLANRLCDLVQLRTDPEGTTVRVHAWR